MIGLDVTAGTVTVEVGSYDGTKGAGTRFTADAPATYVGKIVSSTDTNQMLVFFVLNKGRAFRVVSDVADAYMRIQGSVKKVAA